MAEVQVEHGGIQLEQTDVYLVRFVELSLKVPSGQAELHVLLVRYRMGVLLLATHSVQ